MVVSLPSFLVFPAFVVKTSPQARWPVIRVAKVGQKSRAASPHRHLLCPLTPPLRPAEFSSRSHFTPRTGFGRAQPRLPRQLWFSNRYWWAEASSSSSVPSPSALKKGMAGFGPAQMILPDDIAAEFRSKVHAGFEHAKSMGVTPRLVAVLASENEAAKTYAEWTQKACQEDGIDFQVLERRKEDVEETVQSLCANPAVHGVMIYYPCFGSALSWHGASMDDYLRDSLPIEKDVEGLCHTYRHLLYRNIRFVQSQSTGNEASTRRRKCLLPCTPLAVVKILEYLRVYDETLPVGDRLQGRNVTVVNRSEVVGRPLAAMLANDGADVFSVDLNDTQRLSRGQAPVAVTESFEEVVRASHILVLGVPAADYRLPTEWVRPGAVVVNVASHPNVDEEALMRVPGVQYVPLVGKVTVAMLQRNLLRLISNFYLPHIDDLCL